MFSKMKTSPLGIQLCSQTVPQKVKIFKTRFGFTQGEVSETVSDGRARKEWCVVEN